MKKDRTKLLSIIEKLLPMELILVSSKTGLNLFEIRSKVGKNQQRDLYFHIDGSHYVTTHGFSKKTQKTPPHEINYAKKLRKEYFERKNNNE